MACDVDNRRSGLVRFFTKKKLSRRRLLVFPCEQFALDCLGMAC
jgi:hypothetical protein